MEVPIPWILFAASIIELILIKAYQHEIFSWNPENGLRTCKNEFSESGEKYSGTWVDRGGLFKENQPKAQWLYQLIFDFLGIYIGWLLLAKFISWVFTEDLLTIEFTDDDLVAIILGFIGISGRFRTILDSVQDWFRR